MVRDTTQAGRDDRTVVEFSDGAWSWLLNELK